MNFIRILKRKNSHKRWLRNQSWLRVPKFGMGFLRIGHFFYFGISIPILFAKCLGFEIFQEFYWLDGIREMPLTLRITSNIRQCRQWKLLLVSEQNRCTRFFSEMTHFNKIFVKSQSDFFLIQKVIILRFTDRSNSFFIEI